MMYELLFTSQLQIWQWCKTLRLHLTNLTYNQYLSNKFLQQQQQQQQ
jgi:hypothetical protein